MAYMRISEGRVSEIRLDHLARTSARITFSSLVSARAIPEPGQYVMAWKPAAIEAPLAIPLFPAEICADGFWATSPVPGNWQPGDEIQLRGPLGHGFRFPAKVKVRHLALAALEKNIARLLPLALKALQDNLAVTLFTDSSLPSLPTDLEVYPLSGLSSELGWADFLALDLPADRLPFLRNILGLHTGMHLPCPGQALMFTAIPCGGLAECGACAVSGLHKWRLACQDGPVFDLNELEW